MMRWLLFILVEYVVYDTANILPFMEVRMEKMAQWGCDDMEFDNMDWCMDGKYREDYGSTTGQEFPSIPEDAQ